MIQPVKAASPLMSKSMSAVIVAQFLSAFGDNALLFAALALIKQQLYPDWSQPVLQMAFVATYIILAPFVGQFADSFSKGRVMMVANLLKLAGAAVICAGMNPFLGYTLVGIGAAAYSPAKYGILGEIASGEQLVKANGLMEASTIAAILLGSVAGGALADWSILARGPDRRDRDSARAAVRLHPDACARRVGQPDLAGRRRFRHHHRQRGGHRGSADGAHGADGYGRSQLRAGAHRPGARRNN